MFSESHKAAQLTSLLRKLEVPVFMQLLEAGAVADRMPSPSLCAQALNVACGVVAPALGGREDGAPRMSHHPLVDLAGLKQRIANAQVAGRRAALDLEI